MNDCTKVGFLFDYNQTIIKKASLNYTLVTIITIDIIIKPIVTEITINEGAVFKSLGGFAALSGARPQKNEGAAVLPVTPS